MSTTTTTDRDEPTEYHLRVQRALENNERVYFHSTDSMLAVWYGGAMIRYFDSRTFEEIQAAETGHYYRLDEDGLRDAIDHRMASEGYVRTGRPNETDL